MKIKVSDLTGAALDWAVAKALELQPMHHYTFEKGHHIVPHPYYEGHDFGFFPSTEWAQGGPIIERKNICLISSTGHPLQATIYKGGHVWVDQFGPTPLIAAMRCFVASELGDEVEIPKELG